MHGPLIPSSVRKADVKCKKTLAYSEQEAGEDHPNPVSLTLTLSDPNPRLVGQYTQRPNRSSTWTFVAMGPKMTFTSSGLELSAKLWFRVGSRKKWREELEEAECK